MKCSGKNPRVSYICTSISFLNGLIPLCMPYDQSCAAVHTTWLRATPFLFPVLKIPERFLPLLSSMNLLPLAIVLGKLMTCIACFRSDSCLHNFFPAQFSLHIYLIHCMIVPLHIFPAQLFPAHLLS